MVTTSTIQLFKDCRYDIYHNMSNFSDITAQNAYYDSLTKISKEAVFNKLGDPFIFDEDIVYLRDCTYGRVRYQEMWWYFQITDMAVNAQGRTVISYKMDAWETHRYQSGLTLGAGTITRHSTEAINAIRSEIQPISYDVTDFDIAFGSNPRKPTVLAVGRDNDNDFPVFLFLDIEDSSRNRILVNSSAFAKYFIDAMADIITNFQLIGMWYSSFRPTSGTWTYSGKNRVYYVKLSDGSVGLPHMMSYYTIPYDNVETAGLLSNDGYITNKFDRIAQFCDERGNVIFTAPDNTNINRSFDMILNMTLSSCQWLINVNYQNGSNDIIALACEPLDFYNDTWAEYQATQREVDIESRKLQSQSSTIGDITSLGTGVLGGALVGSVVPGIGTALGAFAGGIASAVGITASAQYSSEYKNPKEQQIVDKSYKRASDVITLQGNGVNGAMMRWQIQTETELYSRFGAGWKCFRYDHTTTVRISNQRKIYGNDVFYPTDDVDRYITNGPFRAVCEVKGVPSSWAGQVQERLAEGVIFK